MSFLDRTFCASPHCTNKCGQRMNEAERALLRSVWGTDAALVSYAYLCGSPTEQEALLQKLKDESQDSDMGY